jgi:NAD(P)-dependent dehydrogenase (short-subunit alcohol dehydrogenase family)
MKTWFITGASRGLGMEVARAALDVGDTVVATARNPGQIKDALPGYGDRLQALALDVTDPAAIDATVGEANQKLGSIDVLVNNAGYGQLAHSRRSSGPRSRSNSQRMSSASST